MIERERNSRSAPDSIFKKLDRRRGRSTTGEDRFVARHAARRGIARSASRQGQSHRSCIRGRRLSISDAGRQRYRLRNRIVENRAQRQKLKREAWADRLRNLDNAWDGDAREFLGAHEIEPSGYEHSLGTIGSGNHFAELQAVESIAIPEICAQLGIEGDAVYLCVHSGSRGFGEAILRDHVAQFGSDGLAVETGEATEYLSRHDHARWWASANRELIAVRVLECLKTEGTRLIDNRRTCVYSRISRSLHVRSYAKGAWR